MSECLSRPATLPAMPHLRVQRVTGIVATGLAVFGGLALLTMIGPADAQDADEIRQAIVVPVSAATLATPEGTERTLRAIDRAALAVCGDSHWEVAPIRAAVEQSACRREAFERAVGASHNVALRAAASHYDFAANP